MCKQTSPRSQWLRRGILVVGWALAIAYAFPGYMSTDSVSQLAQGRGLEPLSDGHPPFMAVMWGSLDRFAPGPIAMLLLQTGSFLFGLDFLLRKFVDGRTAALIAVLVLLFPPVLAPMGVIWKDSQMCGYAFAGAALLLAPRRWQRALGFGVLLAATAVRYNAPAAVFPIVLVLFDWRAAGWRRHVLAVGLWLTITVLAFAINDGLSAKKEHEWYSSLALHDVVGTIKHSHPIADLELEHDLAATPLVVHSKIQAHCRWQYVATNHWNLWHGERRIFDPPATASQRSAVWEAWWTLVTHHPRAYLHHRWSVFAAVLHDPLMRVWGEFVENDYQRALVNSTAQHSSLQVAWLEAEVWLSTTFLFQPSFYFTLSLVMLALCRARIGIAVLASGICHELALFVFAPSNDYRYSHWMIVCTIVGTIITFVVRLSQKRSPCSRAPERLVAARPSYAAIRNVDATS